MRPFFLFFMLLCFLVMPGTSKAVATPEYTPNTSCTVLGTTHMAAGNGGLVFCALVNANGDQDCAHGCIWKSMTASGSEVIPTGLYGYCTDGGTAYAPAYLAGFSRACACPAGYRLVLTGDAITVPGTSCYGDGCGPDTPATSVPNRYSCLKL